MQDLSKYPEATGSVRDNIEHPSLVEIESRELSKIPELALVAFAARCARRVVPLLQQLGDDTYAAAIKCIEIMESAGAGKRFTKRSHKLLSPLQRADSKTQTDSVRYATEALFNAFACADSRHAAYTLEAARAAHDAAVSSVGAEVASLDKAQRHDLEILVERASRESWTDKSPVEPSIFPPIETITSLVKVRSAISPPSGVGTSITGNDESNLLPRSTMWEILDHGFLALSSRQAMRIVDLVPNGYRRSLFETLLALQDSAANEMGDPLLGLSTKLCQTAQRIEHDPEATSYVAARAVARAVYALGRSTRCVWAESRANTESFSRTSLVFASHAARLAGRDELSTIRQDIEALFAYTDRLKDLLGPYPIDGAGRRRRGKFPQEIFATYLEFDTDAPIAGESILTLSPLINTELIARLAEHPRLIYELTAREFEELIAKVFEVYGFTVELTVATRDNGRDVIAIAHQPARVKYLIECKRYAPTNSVGIALVQRLHGVLRGESGTKAILATTSSFTKSAKRYLEQPHVTFELEGRDFEGVQRWLALADRLSLARKALGNHFRISASGLIVPTSLNE